MTNSYYNKTGVPATGAPGLSQDIRAEFAGIEAGFNKLPTLAGNANKAVLVNSGGNGLDVDNAGTIITKTDLGIGAQITLVAGVVTVPTKGQFFTTTAASVVSVTGFTDVYQGRTVSIYFNNQCTLVNSAALALANSQNRVTSPGDIITLVNFATGVWHEVNYRYGLGVHSCHINRNNTNVATAVVTNTPTLLPFNTARYDPYGMFAPGTATITIKTPGLYHILFSLRLGGTVTGASAVTAWIFLNGGQLAVGLAPATSTSWTITASTDAQLAAGDVLTFLYSIAATAAGIDGNNSITYAALHKIG